MLQQMIQEVKALMDQLQEVYMAKILMDFSNNNRLNLIQSTIHKRTPSILQIQRYKQKRCNMDKALEVCQEWKQIITMHMGTSQIFIKINIYQINKMNLTKTITINKCPKT